MKKAYVIFSLAALLALANCNKKEETPADQSTDTAAAVTDSATEPTSDAAEAATADDSSSSDEKSE